MPAPLFPGIGEPVLPFGAGRSYGDSCTLADGKLLDSRPGAAIIQFSPHTGRLTAESGVSLGAIMRAIGPYHTLSVVPGTQFVTLGGAIANDIHGKNHHRRGSFGACVEGFTLRRSDTPGRIHCRPGDPLFAATIGGMGMTGLIESATVRCLPVPSTTIRQTTVRLASLTDYFERSEAADEAHEYAVAWIDSLAGGEHLGRGHLIVGDHADVQDSRPARWGTRLAVPLTPPVSVLNQVSLRAFNTLYNARVPAAGTTALVQQESFFFPLDRIRHWNRLYGPRGLHQHQSVLPAEHAQDAVREMLRLTQKHHHGSFLTVLKRMGANQSPAWISFSRPGVTLTLDFPDRGRSTLALLDALDAITLAAGGAVNPYKDKRMPPHVFDHSMPRWPEVEAMRDRAIVSDFWRRTALALKRDTVNAALADRHA